MLRVETVGPHMHEMDVFRLDEARSLSPTSEAGTSTASRDPAPAHVGTGVVNSHDVTRVVWVKEHFEPGRYVLWCEMPMTADPDAPVTDFTHADVGMHREFTVPE